MMLSMLRKQLLGERKYDATSEKLLLAPIFGEQRRFEPGEHCVVRPPGIVLHVKTHSFPMK
jgi:hypothetical protein